MRALPYRPTGGLIAAPTASMPEAIGGARNWDCRYCRLRDAKHLMRFLEEHWVEPDEGIWEVGGPRRHFIRAKVVAWVAADRAVRFVERLGLTGLLDRQAFTPLPRPASA